MFTDSNVRMIVAAAKSAGIEPAALLAVVECETSGQPFEQDGRTPRLLFERHVAWREAQKVSKSVWSAFKAAGLAIPKWSRSTQYKDQGKSAGRLRVIAAARAIHEETANRSASWGLGQSMGFGFKQLGFSSATAMVEYMVEGGLEAQLEMLLREIKAKRLIGAMNAHDFTTFARKYNGPGYAQNNYDTRMMAAWRKWSRSLDAVLRREKPPGEQSLSRDERKAIQKQLFDLGYKGVGIADGVWGKDTIGAVSAFQANEGLKVTGHYDDATKDALENASEALPSVARASTTADDLRGKGSRTIDAADGLVTAGNVKKGIGALMLGGGAAEQTGLLDSAQDAVEQVDRAKTVYETVHDWLVPFISNPTVIFVGVLLLIGGFVVVKYGKQIIEARVDDQRSGAHRGIAED